MFAKMKSECSFCSNRVWNWKILSKDDLHACDECRHGSMVRIVGEYYKIYDDQLNVTDTVHRKEVIGENQYAIEREEKEEEKYPKYSGDIVESVRRKIEDVKNKPVTLEDAYRTIDQMVTRHEDAFLPLGKSEIRMRTEATMISGGRGNRILSTFTSTSSEHVVGSHTSPNMYPVVTKKGIHVGNIEIEEPHWGYSDIRGFLDKNNNEIAFVIRYHPPRKSIVARYDFFMMDWEHNLDQRFNSFNPVMHTLFMIDSEGMYVDEVETNMDVDKSTKIFDRIRIEYGTGDIVSDGFYTNVVPPVGVDKYRFNLQTYVWETLEEPITSVVEYKQTTDSVSDFMVSLYKDVEAHKETKEKEVEDAEHPKED